ncbi:hypothetical protein PVAND_014092 [Polypedilum vanderplanki]|uniref:CRAL-TRIO domain-containing protein n=1 Tax=Polypedilum vanderplanki TaxID=319348 RepID=A0A9J6CRA9_POLVA|nr:hypothetical protein PVAND_014092 [Polypedilum vanderplanki]
MDKEIYLLNLENKILKETAKEKYIESKNFIKQIKALEENLMKKSDELKSLYIQQQIQSIINQLNIRDLTSDEILRKLYNKYNTQVNELKNEIINLQKTVGRREFEKEHLVKQFNTLKSENAELRSILTQQKSSKEVDKKLLASNEKIVMYDSDDDDHSVASSTIFVCSSTIQNQKSLSIDAWKKNVYARVLENGKKNEKKIKISHLGETKEALIEGIREIREFINEDTELKNVIITDRILIYFLRSNKFRIERVKKKIRSFYIHRLEINEWFINRDPFLTKINELLKIGIFLPVIEKNELKQQIVILRIGAHNPKIHLQNDVMKTSLMVLDWLTFNDETISIYGIRAIFDMKNITLYHALQMTPIIIKRAVYLMDSYPTRIQQLHFVNAHRGINIVLDIFKKFMPQKLQERILVTRENPEFKASDHLPIDLGGTNKSYKELAKYWKHKLEKNHLWFNENIENI